MLFVSLGLGALMLILSILLRVAAFFRLGIPLLYALVVPTVFHTWTEAHPVLSENILWVLLAFTVISWLYTFVRKIHARMERRRDEQIASVLFLRRLDQARAEGRDTVSTEGLFRT